MLLSSEVEIGARARIGYLGPEGTFCEEALLGSVEIAAVQPVALQSIYDAVMAVQHGSVDLSLVPIENSIEGSVDITLDTLAGEASDVEIVGELVLAVHQCLIGSKMVALSEIQTVVSHPQASGQCALFLRNELAHAEILSANSTAEAVRIVSERPEPTWAALGSRLAAELYGCVVLREEIEDRPDNQTRFVWLGHHGLSQTPLPLREGLLTAGGMGKTSLVFWGPGSESSGWLVRCLDEFASRKINLTKIESRPRRERLGHYMFFADLEGQTDDEAVADAVTGLEALCHEVRVLGSYTTT